MFPLKIVLTILLISSTAICQNSIETTVEYSSGVDMLRTKTHPVKPGECWGRGDDSHTSSHMSKEQKKTELKGAIKDLVPTEDYLTEKNAQNINWETRLDSEQEIFINFNKSVSAPEHYENAIKCNTTKWYYTVTKANTSLKTQVGLMVPDDIWFVSIKRDLQLSKLTAKETVSGLFPLGLTKFLSNPDFSIRSDFAENGYNYYLAKPFSEITLAFEINDQSLVNASALGQYKVDFIGSNRCEAIIKEHGGWTTESMRGVIEKQETGPEGLHESILYFGCLTHKKHLQKLFSQNNYQSIHQMLQNMDKLMKESRLTLEEKQLNEAKKALRTILRMAEFTIAQNLLVDVLSYCHEYKLMDLVENKVLATERRYIAVAESIDKILAALDKVLPSGHHDFLAQLKNLHDLGFTYQDLFKSKEEKEKLHFAGQLIAKPRVYLLRDLERSISYFPKEHIVGSEAHSKALKELEDLDPVLMDIFSEFETLARKVKTQSSERVQYQSYEEKIKRAEALIQSATQYFKAQKQTFNSSNQAKEFRTMTLDSTATYVNRNFGLLKEIYGGFLEEFLTSGADGKTIEELGRTLNQQINEASQCLH